MSVPHEMEDFLASVQRSHKRMVENVGITINVQKAYETFASKIDKTVDELTENQKRQAFFDATMANSEKRGETL